MGETLDTSTELGAITTTFIAQSFLDVKMYGPMMALASAITRKRMLAVRCPRDRGAQLVLEDCSTFRVSYWKMRDDLYEAEYEINKPPPGTPGNGDLIDCFLRLRDGVWEATL